MRRAMSRSSSRIAGASMKNSTTGYGPSRSGWTMEVVVAACLVAISTVCSIIWLHQLHRLYALLLQERLGVVDGARERLGIARRQAIDGFGDELDGLHAVLGLLVDQAVHSDAGGVH